MTHRVRAEKSSPFANHDHREWTNPFTDEPSTESFWDLYEDALDSVSDYVRAVLADDFDEAAAEALTANLNFSGRTVNPEAMPEEAAAPEAPAVSVATRHVMQANKSKNTKPELRVRAALRDAGLSGYRLHWKKAPGKPDICYPGRRVAIFVNGCFWHRCPHCALPLPKSNVDFWRAKFARNRARDEALGGSLGGRVVEVGSAAPWKLRVSRTRARARARR